MSSTSPSLTLHHPLRALRRAMSDPRRASREAMRRVGEGLGLRESGPRDSVEAIEQWLRAVQTPPVRGRVLLLAIRNHTWTEWAAYCACVIRSLGFESTIAFFGDEIDRLYPPDSRERAFWRHAGRIPGIELLDLGKVPVNEPDMDRWRQEARGWSAVAVSYDEHLEEADVLQGGAQFDALRRDLEQRSVRGGAALTNLLASRTFTRAFCPSGLIGETRILLSALRARDVETVCVEGWAWRAGHLIYNLNAPALEYNAQGWINSFGPWTHEQDGAVDQYLGYLDGAKRARRGWLSNFYRIQRGAIDAAPPAALQRFVEGDAPTFLMAPNVVGDSSTLRSETIFPSQQAWTRDLIRWFAARPDLKLIVRAHPAERWIGGKCRIYMGDVAREAAAGAANIYVVGSEEKLNTFTLLPRMRAGLVWMSSAGVECVVRGRPSIVAARPKYTGLGIAEEPASREEYFAAIARHAARRVEPSPEQVRRGRQYLHMVFRGFSFEATGRNFRATGCRMGQMPNQAEHDRFYRILVGDEAMPDITRAETRAS